MTNFAKHLVTPGRRYGLLPVYLTADVQSPEQESRALATCASGGRAPAAPEVPRTGEHLIGKSPP